MPKSIRVIRWGAGAAALVFALTLAARARKRRKGNGTKTPRVVETRGVKRRTERS